jgi:eukaryotic-like serine/threonine-protein kinase
MRFGLHLVRGARAGEILTLEDNQTAVIGRGTDTTFRIQDPSISRRHCQISNTPRGLLVADLGSSNGTYVNSQRLQQGWAQLSHGDQVILGQNELRIQAMQAPQPQMGAPGPAPNQYPCGHCGRAITQQEIQFNRYRQDTNGRLICADCLKQFDFDPHMVEGYQIQKKLGQGAFGSVFKAVQTSDSRIVALKTIRPQLVSNDKDIQRFFREADTGRKLVHPNITGIYDAGESKGVYYIAMEFIDGNEVSKLIEEYGCLDVGYSMRVVIQIANALQHAYEQGIVHRDIKPENIMVNTQGAAKLVDFGLAKSFTQSGQSGLTAPGEGMGTLAYMPPEQLDNALNADQRSDIYSLGATLYHMLSGQRPFNEKTTRSFIMKILNSMPDPIRKANPAVPQELEDIIQRAMSKTPEDRYQEPKEMESELTQLFNRLAAEYASRSGEH